MALTFDATNVRDFDSLTEDEKVTYNSLIWATMAVGMNTITEANAREFFARASFVEKVNGAYRVSQDGPLYFTPEDVLRFIGLRTNATPMTITQFRKNMWESHTRWNVPRNFGE
jgi:hypothetical protein